MQIIQIDPKKLIAYKNNAKNHSKKQIELIKKSITEFSFLNPIIIDCKNEIIAGHARQIASLELGLKTVPCIYAEHLTPNQIKAYRLADNKLSEIDLSWDEDLLKIELDDLKLDFNVEDFGFDLGETIKSDKDYKNKEISEEEFSEFDCKCPKCGFEFDNE